MHNQMLQLQVTQFEKEVALLAVELASLTSKKPLIRVAVCCSVVHCVAVWCTLLQCGALCCSVVHCVAVWYSVLQCGALCCSVVHCGAVWCTVLQCGALCCSALRQ